MNTQLSFAKQEHLCSKKLIDSLFGGGGRSMVAFPLRVVYMKVPLTEQNAPLAEMMVSVSKHHFKRAVKRNRVKRQVREAYRNNKSILLEALASKENERIIMAFVWQEPKIRTSADVEEKMTNLLHRIVERL